MPKQPFKRVLIKISGTSFAGADGKGIDPAKVAQVAEVIKDAKSAGVELAIVNGGGNLFRYRQVADTNMRRIVADSVGMLGTMMNSLALQDMLEQAGIGSKIYSSTGVNNVIKPFVIDDALTDLENDKVVIISGGTGHPFFTTDTAAVLRALEIGAEVVVKATDVDGVYDSDPQENPEAKLFGDITFAQTLQKGLRVMDATSFALAQDNNLPIIVLNFTKPNALRKAIAGEDIGTFVHN